MHPTLALFAAVLGVFVNAVRADLRSSLSDAGVQAIFPGDPNYETEAAAFNQRYQYLPAAIALPTSGDQVAKTIQAGVEAKVYVNARGGGHSYTAFAFGGENGHLLIDMKNLNNVTVDSSTNVATIGAGNLLGDTAIALNSQGGRALPHGTCPYVGIGGHAAYGGFGFTSRAWGLTLDTLVAIDVVLANSTQLTVSSSSNSDLFWALRGAAPSFGVITAYHAKTQAAPAQASVYSVSWDFDVDQLANGLEAWQNFTTNADLPPEFGGEINLGRGSSNGKISFELAGAYYGENSNPQGVIQAFLDTLPQPTSAPSIKTTDWIDSLQALAGNQALSSQGVNVPAIHDTFYAKSLMTPESEPISSSALQAFAKYLSTQGWSSDTQWFVQFELYGGKNSAINAVAEDATAFARRGSHFTIQFYASSQNYEPPYPDAGFTFLDGMVNSIVSDEPGDWPYGAYTNYVDDRLQDWQQEYYDSHYQRLSQIKAQVDPNNVFKFPQVILPSTSKRRRSIVL